MTAAATTPVGTFDEAALVTALKRGSEDAFASLVDLHGAAMLRVARTFVTSRAVAEEVVQETWLRVLRGLPAFEGRSSLRTWIFVILANCARRRAAREARSIPFAALLEGEDAGAAVPPEQFFPSDHPRWPGCWSTVVDGWSGVPEERLLSRETREVLARAIAGLPPGQRAVMTLRDVEGCSADEVCDVLGLTPENQRVLLHRARTRVRARLAPYLEVGT